MHVKDTWYEYRVREANDGIAIVQFQSNVAKVSSVFESSHQIGFGIGLCDSIISKTPNPRQSIP
jgi:hypothetical protein